MPIDTEERYEADPAQDLQMSDELQHEVMVDQQETAEAATQAAMDQPAPTEAQPPGPEPKPRP